MRTLPKALLFDLGNVVIKFDFDRCFAAWANASGLDFAVIKNRFKFDDAYAAHEISEITMDQYHQHVCKTTGARLTYTEFLSGWNDIYVGVIPETLTLIEENKAQRKIYAFTNSNISHRQVWTNMFANQLKLFDRVFCSSQLKLRKPDHIAFAAILQEVGLNAGELLFVDDLEVNVQSARSYGIKSYLFDDPKISVHELRKLLCENQ